MRTARLWCMIGPSPAVVTLRGFAAGHSCNMRASRLVIAAAFVVALPACSRPAALPPVPQDIGNARLTETLVAADRAARQAPTDASAVGALAMRYHANLFYDQAQVGYARARELDPENPRWSYYLGTVAQSIGINDGVPALMAEADLHAAGYPPARLRAANARFNGGDFEAARQEYGSCVDDPGCSPHARLGLARIAMARDELTTAREHLDAALDVMPDFGEALDLLAVVHAAQGREAEAEVLRRQALAAGRAQLPPDPWMDELWDLCLRVDHLLVMADRAVTTHQGLRASRFYQLALKADPQSARSRLEFANALSKRGQVAEAIPLLREAIALDPGLAGAHWRLGEALMQVDSLDESLAAGRRGLELDPRNADAHTVAGRIHAARREIDEAMQAFGTALALDRDHVQANVNLGHLLLTRGRLTEADTHYRRALAIAPTTAGAHAGLGTAAVKRGDFAAAARAFAQAARFKPDDPHNHFDLGVALSRLGRGDEAMAAYRETLRLDAKHALAMANLGAEMEQRGDVDEAITLYRHALELDRDNASLHNNLGFALARKGRWAEAIAAYQRALAINPKHPQAAANLAAARAATGDQ